MILSSLTEFDNQRHSNKSKIPSQSIFNPLFKCKIRPCFVIYKDHKGRCINSNLRCVHDFTNFIFWKAGWSLYLLLIKNFVEFISSDSLLIFTLKNRYHLKKVFEPFSMKSRNRYNWNMFCKIKIGLSSLNH